MENEPKPKVDEGQGELMETSIIQIVGGTEDEQQELFNFHHDQMHNDQLKDFEYNGKTYKVADFEREKTEEEREITRDVLDKLADFMGELGDPNPLKIRPEQVHFLNAEKAKAENLPRVNFFDIQGQYIGIYDSGSNLANAQGVAHEATHFHSFQSLQISKDKSTSVRRFGISARIRESQIFYFDEVNEATTAELTKIFDKEFFGQIPGLQKELAERQEFISRNSQDHPEVRGVAEDVAYITDDPVTGGKTGVCYTYHKERDQLNFLIDDMFAKGNAMNAGMFEDRDEVFGLFVQAALGGPMLDLARSIETIYGKGAFRKLGEGTKR